MIDTTYTRIKALRTELNLSQTELANRVGYSDKTAIAKVEAGKVDLPQSKVIAFAKALGTTPSYLIGESKIDTVPIESGYIIPVLGRVCAGNGSEAIEEQIDTIEISQNMAKKGNHFGLVIKGDSMTPLLSDGDIVIINRDADTESGDLVVALVNGCDAMCKRLQRYSEGFALIPENPLYEPKRYTCDDINEIPVKIIGKVVESRRKY